MLELNLKDALNSLPPPVRVAFLEILLGVPLTAKAPQALPTDPPQVIPVPMNRSLRSYPINIAQAYEIISRLNKDEPLMLQVLTAAVSNVHNGVGVINWRDILPMSGGMSWGTFGRGRRAALHRSLRAVLREHGVQNVDHAELLWEAPGWVPDGKGGWSSGELRIDGPAVQALQAILLNSGAEQAA